MSVGTQPVVAGYDGNVSSCNNAAERFAARGLHKVKLTDEALAVFGEGWKKQLRWSTSGDGSLTVPRSDLSLFCLATATAGAACVVRVMRQGLTPQACNAILLHLPEAAKGSSASWLGGSWDALRKAVRAADRVAVADASFEAYEPDHQPAESRTVTLPRTDKWSDAVQAAELWTVHDWIEADGTCCTLGVLLYILGDITRSTDRGCFLTAEGDVQYHECHLSRCLVLLMDVAEEIYGVPDDSHERSEQMRRAFCESIWESELFQSRPLPARLSDLRRMLAKLRSGARADPGRASAIRYAPSEVLPPFEALCSLFAKDGVFLAMGPRMLDAILQLHAESRGTREPGPIAVTLTVLRSVQESLADATTAIRGAAVQALDFDRRVQWAAERLRAQRSRDESSDVTSVLSISSRSSLGSHPDLEGDRNSKGVPSHFKANLLSEKKSARYERIATTLTRLHEQQPAYVEIDMLAAISSGVDTSDGPSPLLVQCMFGRTDIEAADFDLYFMSAHFCPEVRSRFWGRVIALATSTRKGDTGKPVLEKSLQSHKAKTIDTEILSWKWSDIRFDKARRECAAARDAGSERYPDVVDFLDSQAQFADENSCRKLRPVVAALLAELGFPGSEKPDEVTFIDALDMVIKRYDEYGTTPAKVQHLAPACVEFLSKALDVMGQRFKLYVKNGNPREPRMEQTIPRHLLDAFLEDSASIQGARTQAGQKEWSEKLYPEGRPTGMSSISEGTAPPAAPSATADDKARGHGEVVAGKKIAEGGKVRVERYKGHEALSVRKPNSPPLWYAIRPAKEKLTELGGSNRCVRVMLSYGHVRPKDACETFGSGEHEDGGKAHAWLRGFQAKNFRIWPDGSVGPRKPRSSTTEDEGSDGGTPPESDESAKRPREHKDDDEDQGGPPSGKRSSTGAAKSSPPAKGSLKRSSKSEPKPPKNTKVKKSSLSSVEDAAQQEEISHSLAKADSNGGDSLAATQGTDLTEKAEAVPKTLRVHMLAEPLTGQALLDSITAYTPPALRPMPIYTCSFPLSTVPDVVKLLQGAFGPAPTALTAMYFSPTLQHLLYHERGVIALQVCSQPQDDRQLPSFQGDFASVANLKEWVEFYGAPNCWAGNKKGHTYAPHKCSDGRFQFGAATFAKCIAVKAAKANVEQPMTHFSDVFALSECFGMDPPVITSPCKCGDAIAKVHCFYGRNMGPLVEATPNAKGSHGWHDVVPQNPIEREHFRSSFARSPNMALALVRAMGSGTGTKKPPRHLDLLEVGAARMYDAGIPVPADFVQRLDARPRLQPDRDYVFHTRGAGDPARMISWTFVPRLVAARSELHLRSSNDCIWDRFGIPTSSQAKELLAAQAPSLLSLGERTLRYMEEVLAGTKAPPAAGEVTSDTEAAATRPGASPAAVAAQGAGTGPPDADDKTPQGSPDTGVMPVSVEAPSGKSEGVPAVRHGTAPQVEHETTPAPKRKRVHFKADATPRRGCSSAGNGKRALLSTLMMASATAESVLLLPVNLHVEPATVLVPAHGGLLGVPGPLPGGAPREKRITAREAAEALLKEAIPADAGLPPPARVCLLGMLQESGSYLSAAPLTSAAMASRVTTGLVWSQLENLPSWERRTAAEAVHAMEVFASPNLLPSPHIKVGALPEAPVPRDPAESAKPLAVETQLRLARQEQQACCALLQEAGSLEPAYQESYLAWMQLISDTKDPPPYAQSSAVQVEARHVLSPPWPLMSAPRRNVTDAVPVPMPQAQLPSGTVLPKRAEDLYCRKSADQIRSLQRKLQRHHRVGGKAPAIRAWGQQCLKPRFRGKIFDYRSGPGTGKLLDTTVPAVPHIILPESAETHFSGTPSQRILSMLRFGASTRASASGLVTMIARPNRSLYQVEGGLHAVAEAHQKLVDLKWNFKAKDASLMVVPSIQNPSGATKRKPVPGLAHPEPRGLLDCTCPHEGQLVICDPPDLDLKSVNARAGPMRHAPGDINPKWFTEVKGKLQHVCADMARLQYVASLLHTVLFILNFDFSKFFHQLVQTAAEMVNTGSLVPERVQAGGAPPRLVSMLYGVTAMGVSPSSNLLQDLGDELMVELIRETHEALAPLISEWRRNNPGFDAYCRSMGKMAWDDAGPMSRLCLASIYTDDSIKVAVGPRPTAAMVIAFHHMIGPAHVTWDADAFSREVARTLGIRHVASTVPRSCGLSMLAASPGKWACGAWLGAELHGPLGVVWLPTPKRLRTLAGLSRLEASQMEAGEYESFASFLISILFVLGNEPYLMHGMFRPMQPGQELERGRATLIQCDQNMQRRITRLKEKVTNAPAAPFLAAIPNVPTAYVPTTPRYVMQGDAALSKGRTDQGLGWFFYGQAVRIPLSWDSRLPLLPISSLECITGAGGVFLADYFVPAAKDVVICSDALATAVCLQRKASSSLLASIHQVYMEMSKNLGIAQRGSLRIRPTWGEAMIFPDAVSRCYDDVLQDLCTACRMPLEWPAAPASLTKFIKGCLDAVQVLQSLWMQHAAPSAPEGSAEMRDAMSEAHVYSTHSHWFQEGVPSMPKVVHVHSECYAAADPEQRVYIGRTCGDLADTGWSNPYSIATAGSREASLDLYTTTLLRDTHQLLRIRKELNGKLLGCWCKTKEFPHRECHGDILAYLANCSPAQIFWYTGLRLPPRPVCAASPPPPALLRFRCQPAKHSSYRHSPKPSEGAYDCLHEVIRFYSGSHEPLPGKGSKQRFRRTQPWQAPLMVTVLAGSGMYGGERLEVIRYVLTPSILKAGATAPEPRPDAPAEKPTKAILHGDIGPRVTRGIGASSQMQSSHSHTEANESKPVLARTMLTGKAALGSELSRLQRVALASADASALVTRLEQDTQQWHRQNTAQTIKRLKGDTSDLALRPADWDMVGRLMNFCTTSRSKALSEETRRKDKYYWRMWVVATSVLGTPAVRYDRAAATGQDEVGFERESTLVSIVFMMWMLSNQSLKPSSIFARLQAVSRCHWKGLNLPFVKLSSVAEILKGVVQEHIMEYGQESVEPHRKEPLENWMFSMWFGMRSGTVGPYVVGNNVHWQGVRALWAYLRDTGVRKSGVALDPGVPFGLRHLSMWHVCYEFEGVRTRTPSKEQLNNPNTNTFLHFKHVPCKNDPTGTRWGATPTSVRWADSPGNLAKEFIAYEIMRDVAPEDRRTTPMFVNHMGTVWRKAALSKLFELMIALVVPAKDRSKYSLHSFRIYLGCALMAAGADKDTIKRMVRWASDEALHIYARANYEVISRWIEEAERSKVSSVRTTSLPEVGDSSTVRPAASAKDVDSASSPESPGSATTTPALPSKVVQAMMECMPEDATAQHRASVMLALQGIPDMPMPEESQVHACAAWLEKVTLADPASVPERDRPTVDEDGLVSHLKTDMRSIDRIAAAADVGDDDLVAVPYVPRPNGDISDDSDTES